MRNRAKYLSPASLALGVVAAALAVTPAAYGAPPPNDARLAPQPVGALPATVRGTTVEATNEPDEPLSSCTGPGKGSVWYTLSTRESRALLIALDAGGDMDATVDVFLRERSQISPVACEATNRRGEATLDLDTQAGGTYLIRVAPRANSVTAGFTMRVVEPDRPAAPPGPRLPDRGASARVDRFANPDDAWSVRLVAGRDYRFNFVGPGRGCARAALYGPGTSSFGAEAIRSLRCDAQTLYTPPRSGRYTIHVQAPRASRAQLPYRLRVGPAGRDDTAPGLVLANDRRVRGALHGRALDALDLYRFSVTERSEVRIRLRTGSDFRADLLSEGGRRLGSGSEFTRRLSPGRYFVAVRANDGAGGRYVLSRLARTITNARMLAGGARSVTIPLGSTIPLGLAVTPAVSGRATLVVERFDPIAGWLFDARLRPAVIGGRASVGFRPPSGGRWRVHGEFDGSRRASPSDGGTASFRVTEPPTGR